MWKAIIGYFNIIYILKPFHTVQWYDNMQKKDNYSYTRI
jgi:hypothetical protein